MLKKTIWAAVMLSLVTCWPSAPQAQAGDTLQIPLSIVGTDVGLCGDNGELLSLGGDLFIRNTNLAIGRYVECAELEVVEGIPVGGTGISVLTFTIHGFTIGSITTDNVSTVVGFDFSTGALLVQSSGVVVGATGIFSNASGGLVSCSSVILAPDFFALDADVTLILTK